MEEVIKVDDCVGNIGDYDIPFHNAIIVPENATNGDMLQAIFPNEKYEVVARTAFDVNGKIINHKVVRVNGLLDYYVMDYDWWDAPYEGE